MYSPMIPIVRSCIPPINIIPTNSAVHPVTQSCGKNGGRMYFPINAYKIAANPQKAETKPKYVAIRKGFVENEVSPSSAKFNIFLKG